MSLHLFQTAFGGSRIESICPQGLLDVHSKYEDAAVEISSSLLLSRNILLALLSLQSWKPFMERWLRSSIMVLEAKAHLTVLDKTSKAATDMLKVHYTYIVVSSSLKSFFHLKNVTICST